jgi:hypothetical protein
VRRRALDAAQPRGVPRDQLEKELPPLTYGAVLRHSRGYEPLPGDGECAVCQADISPPERVRLLPCRHVFHVGCIDPWLERSTCCPTCRAAVCTDKES